MHIGSSLRDARMGARLTRLELARALGIDPSTLYRIERGEVTPSARTVEAIARWLKRAA